MRRSLFIPSALVFLAAAAVHAAPIGEGPNSTALLAQGFSFSHNDSVRLEARLQDYDFDLAARIPLLTYYSNKIASNPYDDELRRDKRRHVLWLIRNQPRMDVTATPWCLIDPKYDHLGYTRGKEAWIEHVQKHPTDAVILTNAARFIMPTESEWSERLLRRALVAAPTDARVHVEMASAAVKRGEMEAAVESLESAIGFAAAEQKQRVYADAAEIALEAGKLAKAKEYADKSLELVMSSRDPLRGAAMHRAHTVLGRIALTAGSTVIARFHLLEAGNTPIPKQVVTLGPNMTLAREMLDKGERQAVLQYIELCATWWSGNDDRLIRWKAELESGQAPNLTVVTNP